MFDFSPRSSSLRHALQFLKRTGVLPLPRLAIFGLALSIIMSTICLILIGLSLKSWTEDFANANLSILNFLVWCGVIIVFALFSAIRVYTATVIGDMIGARLRAVVFSRVVGRPLTYFEDNSAGNLISVIVSDITVIQMTVRSSLSPLVRNSLIMTGAGAMMVATSWKLTLLSLLTLPVPIVATLIMAKQHKQLLIAIHERTGQIAARTAEIFTAMATVKALNRERLEVEAFESFQNKTSGLLRRLAGSRAILLFIVVLTGLLTLTLIFCEGRIYIETRAMSPGTLSSFLFFLLLAAGSCVTLGNCWSGTVDALSALHRVMSVCELPPGRTVMGPANVYVNRNNCSGPKILVFERVSFRYPSRPEVLALDDVSFRVAAGETVALVGSSGAGKSTIARLLLGFDIPERGSIFVDETDIRTIEPERLRGWYAAVLQDSFIFSTSLTENIRYGRPDATEQEVEAASRAAAVHLFANELPHGMNTFLGQRGSRLSPGQKQRVLIARALLRDASILLLDEATSALDSITESLVQKTIQRVRGLYTTLVIAHKLSTVRLADRIILLNSGKVQATGTHDDLMRTSELYRNLVQLQFERNRA